MSLDTQDKIYLSEIFDQKFDHKFKAEFKIAREQINEDFQRHTNSLKSEFKSDMDRQTGILREDFQHKVDTVIEMLNDKPGRGEFNELKDEVSNMHREMGIFQLNLKDHERRIGRLEVARR